MRKSYPLVFLVIIFNVFATAAQADPHDPYNWYPNPQNAYEKCVNKVNESMANSLAQFNPFSTWHWSFASVIIYIAKTRFYDECLCLLPANDSYDICQDNCLKDLTVCERQADSRYVICYLHNQLALQLTPPWAVLWPPQWPPLWGPQLPLLDCNEINQTDMQLCADEYQACLPPPPPPPPAPPPVPEPPCEPKIVYGPDDCEP